MTICAKETRLIFTTLFAFLFQTRSVRVYASHIFTNKEIIRISLAQNQFFIGRFVRLGAASNIASEKMLPLYRANC